MPKDKSESALREKKEKKDKKRKHEEANDEVTTVATPAKKEKKDKKRKSEVAADESAMDVDGQSALLADDAAEPSDKQALASVPLAALVPFANPLADDKAQKKVLKSVKKGMRLAFSSRHYSEYTLPCHIIVHNPANTHPSPQRPSTKL